MSKSGTKPLKEVQKVISLHWVTGTEKVGLFPDELDSGQ